MRFLKMLRFGILALSGVLGQPAHAASTELVSANAAGSHSGNRASDWPSISADGRFVAFHSSAVNLVHGDDNNADDIFVRDRLTGTTELISVGPGGVQGNADSVYYPSISADGRYVAFASKATNLVPNDTNGSQDVFVRDRQTQTTELIPDPNIGEFFGQRGWPSISGDGQMVAFVSDTYPDAVNEKSVVIVYDRQTGETTEHAVANGHPGASSSPSISADGHFLVWSCNAQDSSGGNDEWHICSDVLQSALLKSATKVISPASAVSPHIGHHEDWHTPVVSADGRFVAYTKTDSNVELPIGFDDVYVQDRTVGAIERISVNPAGEEANGSSSDPAITPDGRFVAFSSDASDLVPGDTNGKSDVFVFDRLTRTMRRVSVDTGIGGFGNSLAPSINADGRVIAFSSAASDLVSGDLNQSSDVFARIRGPNPDARSSLLVDFGSRGLWESTVTGGWQKITDVSPSLIATGDLDGNFVDEALASFPLRGLVARYNNAGGFLTLHNSVPSRVVSGDFDGNGADDVAADFGAQGILVRVNSGTWTQVRTSSSRDLQVGDLDGNGQDELVAILGNGGIWARFNNANWVRLRSGSPVRIATGDLDGNREDDVIADYGSLGLLVQYDNAGPFVRIHNGNTQSLATGDLDGDGKAELLADLGSNGLWVYYDNAAPWVKLDTRSPVFMLAADLDRSGKDDVVADFGATGLWARYNDKGPFQQIKAWPSQGVLAGAFERSQ